MRKLTLLPIILLCHQWCLAQANTSSIDTMEIETVINNKSLTLYSGTGFQRSFYYEVGLGSSRFRGNSRGQMSNYGFYTGFEHSVRNKKYHQVNGVKAGAYFATVSGGYAVDIKYMWYQKKHDWVITPKIGIGLAGMIMINYGYNISLNNQTFEQIGKHQFSLTFHLPIKFIKIK